MTQWILCGLSKEKNIAVGKLLAQKTKQRFIDADHLFTGANTKLQESQLIANEIQFLLKGSYSRTLENNVFTALDDVKNCVISLGSEELLKSENGERIRRLGSVVFLYDAPLDSKQESFTQSLKAKIIDTKGLTPDQIVDAILQGDRPLKVGG